MKPFWCGLLAVCMAFSIGFFFGVKFAERRTEEVVSSKHNPPTDKIFERGFIK